MVDARACVILGSTIRANGSSAICSRTERSAKRYRPIHERTMLKAKGNEVLDETGKQMAVVLASNCTNRDAKR